jgi:transposase-like protein
MGVFKQRKIPLSIKGISNIFECANKKCRQEIIAINNSKDICSCPECKSNQYAKYTGTNKGMKKFICKNPVHDKSIWFSTSTSSEAIKIYQGVMAENICQLTKTNSCINGIQEINETSKYFVEFSFECLCQYVDKESPQKISLEGDITTIFLDVSGSGLARNKALILAKVKDKVIFNVITTSNHLSAHQLLASIKNKIQISNKTKLVFITDGEACFVDSIKHFFPRAIHIRQFHNKSCKGIIYIHLKYKREEYTVRCLWDVVLNEGVPSKKVLQKRIQRARVKTVKKDSEKFMKYSELKKDIMVWKGIVYDPRGVRRILRGKIKIKSQVIKKDKEFNTSTNDGPKLIFKGKIEEAKELPIFMYCFKILKKIFGGLHITSNVVENVFNIKSKLRAHRSMKFGKRLLICIMYGNLILKDLNKEELKKFIKEKVVTYDFLRQNVLYGSGLQKNKPVEISFLDLIKEGLKTKKNLVIHYCDYNNKHTSRIITPKNIITNDYNKRTCIESYCHMRKAKRTFNLDRIRDAAIFEPESISF